MLLSFFFPSSSTFDCKEAKIKFRFQ